MKIYRMAGAVLLVLALFSSLGVMTAAAQGPTGTTPSNAPYPGNQTLSVPANSDTWYRFDYAVNNDTGERPVTTITLVNGAKDGLDLEIWAPNELNDMADNKPVGKGNLVPLDCDTGVPAGAGLCQSPDLVWTGAFGASGPYYVHLINNGNSPMNAQLSIQGSGVSLAPQTAASNAAASNAPAPSAPSAAPAAAANASDDPARSANIDGQSHNLAAGGATWYRFDYAVNNDTGAHPIMTITLVNGNQSGVHFQVYAPENINDWWDNSPTGQGTAAQIDCDTGAPSAQGECQSHDLTWTGAFGTSGAYFVRVINDNNSPANYVLTIQ